MRYFVSTAEESGTGQRYVAFVARVGDDGVTQIYDVAQSQWVGAQPWVGDNIDNLRGWEPTDDSDIEDVLSQLRARREWLATQVEPGHWLTVTANDDEPKLLIRSTDGYSVEGYAVSSGRWELMPYAVSPALNDPALWQPVADADVAEVQGWLHLLWDRKQQATFDAKAPELVDPELTEATVREVIVHYIVEILKVLPDDLVVGSQGPGLGPLGWGSGPLGPGGSWNFEVGYWVWGYPAGPAMRCSMPSSSSSMRGAGPTGTRPRQAVVARWTPGPAPTRNTPTTSPSIETAAAGCQ